MPQVCAEDSGNSSWGRGGGEAVAGSVAPSVSPVSPCSCGLQLHRLSYPHHAALVTGP